MSNERQPALTFVAYSEDWFSQFNLSRTFVRHVLVIAILLGLAAAAIDRLLGLPVNTLAVSVSGVFALGSGMAYALLKRKADRPGFYMGLLAGWLTYMIWFVALQLAGVDAAPFAALDWFEALVMGLALGASGFAVFAGIRRYF